eukprot:11185404-Lingulodinium_polyedra.AAC.1
MSAASLGAALVLCPSCSGAISVVLRCRFACCSRAATELGNCLDAIWVLLGADSGSVCAAWNCLGVGRELL